MTLKYTVERIQGQPILLPTPERLAEIRARIRDGIFLGGDYNTAYEEFLRAHADRCQLLVLVADLQRRLDEAGRTR